MIKLNIGYKEWSVYYESNTLFEGLANSYAAIGDIPYRIVGIDVDVVRKTVNSTNAKDFASALEEIKINERGEYGALYDSLIFEMLVEKFVDNVVPKTDSRCQPAKFKDKVFFVSDEEEWIAIKKMSIYPETEPREVAAFLFGIKSSILSKYLSLKYQDKTNIESEMEKTLRGKRRSLSALKELYKEYGKDVPRFIVGADILGYSLTPKSETLAKVFPEIKLPGIKGRKPKG